MKKTVVAFAATSMIFTGMATASVSAEEHEVQRNDSLWGIADQYETSVQSLMDVNELDSTVIQPGEKIEVSGSEKADDIYKVKKGDTLSGIAMDYDVKVKEIEEWNDLSSDVIQIGQELTMKDVDVSQDKVVEEEETPNTEETEEQQETESEEASTDEGSEKQAAEGETMTVTATAYTAKCEGCSGVTSTGIDLNANPNKKVIAVDPNVIPLGTEVHVEGYGNAVAGDVGGAIKGDKIDVHVPTTDEANQWGVQTVDVTILD